MKINLSPENMDKIVWSDKLCVGNSLIDTQHKRLFEITNNLIEESNTAKKTLILRETLRELLEYVKYHFSEEEQLMLKYHYNKIDEHQEEHEQFFCQVAEFCEGIFEGKNLITEELVEFLSSWIVQHVGGRDQELKNYLSEK